MPAFYKIKTVILGFATVFLSLVLKFDSNNSHLILKPFKNENMIARIWHGRTTLSNADSYEKLLRQDVFTTIEEKHIVGS